MPADLIEKGINATSRIFGFEVALTDETVAQRRIQMIDSTQHELLIMDSELNYGTWENIEVLLALEAAVLRRGVNVRAICGPLYSPESSFNSLVESGVIDLVTIPNSPPSGFVIADRSEVEVIAARGVKRGGTSYFKYSESAANDMARVFEHLLKS